MSSAGMHTPPVVAIVGARDGAGKTTVAVNLASAMSTVSLSSSRMPGVLVDFDVHFGGVESALQVRPEFRVDDAVRKLSSRSKSTVETFLAGHHGGFGVLCAPTNPIVADQLQPPDVFGVLERLTALSRPTIIDTAGGLNEYALGSVERASHTFVVSGTDVGSVRATRKLIDTWTQLGIDVPQLGLVLTQPPGRQRLSASDIREVIGHPVVAVIPHSEALAASLDAGVPLVLSDRRSKPSKVFVRLAESVLRPKGLSTEVGVGGEADDEEMAEVSA